MSARNSFSKHNPHPKKEAHLWQRTISNLSGGVYLRTEILPSYDTSKGKYGCEDSEGGSRNSPIAMRGIL